MTKLGPRNMYTEDTKNYCQDKTHSDGVLQDFSTSRCLPQKNKFYTVNFYFTITGLYCRKMLDLQSLMEIKIEYNWHDEFIIFIIVYALQNLSSNLYSA